MQFSQFQLELPPRSRGFHLVTDHITSAADDLQDYQTGMMQVFIRHTSASLSINENADPDVPVDLEMAFNKIAPESFPYVHTMEGPDDMPAHVKASMIGSSVTIPISDGRLMLGTWQGIYLCEHRNRAGSRKLVISIWGNKRDS